MSHPLNTGAAIDEALKPRVAALEEWQMSTHFTALSGRVKKRPLVLFFGRDTFADNSKYLYLQALAAPRGYEVLWCAFDTDLVAQLQAADVPATRGTRMAALSAALADTVPLTGVVAPEPYGLIHRRVKGAVVWNGWLHLPALSLAE